MAGALTIDTLNNASGVFATNNAFSGIAKAWVNFNGTVSPPSIRKSFNITSITKTSTGKYTASFSNSMADSNYSAAGNASAGVDGGTLRGPVVGAKTTSSFLIECQNIGSAAGIDVANCDVIIFD